MKLLQLRGDAPIAGGAQAGEAVRLDTPPGLDRTQCLLQLGALFTACRSHMALRVGMG
jgi:hypothetical protein